MKNSSSLSLPLDFNPSFDGFRGIAILLVILSHSYIASSESQLSRYWHWISITGWVGVDMFFVLSGFLITRILISSKSSQSYFKNFYVRRCLRIFPLYYLFLFFCFFISSDLIRLKTLFPVDKTHLLSHLTLTSNLLFAKLGFYPGSVVDISWSLSIEEQFYLFWPLLVWKSSVKNLRLYCLGILLLSETLRGFQYLIHGSMNKTYFFTLTRWDGMIWGASLATLFFDPPLLNAFLKKSPFILSISFLMVLLSFSNGIHISSPLLQLIGLPSLAIFFTALLLQLTSESILTPFFQIPFLRTLGRFSYGLYLLHQLVIAAFVNTHLFTSSWPWFQEIPLLGTILFQLIALLLSLFLAILVYYCFEIHFLNLKRFFYAPRRLLVASEN